MATYTHQDAIDYVSKVVKGIPTTAMDATAADTVNSIIYRYWFWKWTMAALTAISAVDGTQDYSITNNDFYRLYRCRLTRTDLTPNAIREIVVMDFLSPNLEQKGSIETIRSASYNYETGKIRLSMAASVPSGITWTIGGDYQIKPTKVTATSTAIIYPEYYFDVEIEGIKWKYMELAGDPRTGGVTIDKQGRRQYSGQLAVFMNALHEMAEAEGMGKGDSQRFPDDGFGAGRATNPGLLAWA